MEEQMDMTEQVPEEEAVDVEQQQEPQVEPSELPTEESNLSPSDRAYLDGLIKLMHTKKTAPKIEDMLESGPPEKAIPETALMVNKMMEDGARKGGKPPSLELLFLAGITVVSDLIEIGNAKGIFEITEESEIQAILQETMQRYIQKGLKDGTVDPVELQEKAGKLMNEEDQSAAMTMGEREGIPSEANEHTAMEVYADQKVRKKGGMLQGGRR